MDSECEPADGNRYALWFGFGPSKKVPFLGISYCEKW